MVPVRGLGNTSQNVSDIDNVSIVTYCFKETRVDLRQASPIYIIMLRSGAIIYLAPMLPLACPSQKEGLIGLQPVPLFLGRARPSNHWTDETTLYKLLAVYLGISSY